MTGKVVALLPFIAVVAVSQAPSPESDPSFMLPVTATVGHYFVAEI